jgi:hypothetical protein
MTPALAEMTAIAFHCLRWAVLDSPFDLHLTKETPLTSLDGTKITRPEYKNQVLIFKAWLNGLQDSKEEFNQLDFKIVAQIQAWLIRKWLYCLIFTCQI